MRRVQPPTGGTKAGTRSAGLRTESKRGSGGGEREGGGDDVQEEGPLGSRTQAARVAALEQAIASSTHLGTAVSDTLAQDKQLRSSLIAIKAGDFKAWRAQAQAQAQEQARARMEALRAAKEAAAAAAAAGAAAKRPGSSATAPVPVK